MAKEIAIKDMYADGVSHQMLMKMFKLSVTQFWLIVK